MKPLKKGRRWSKFSVRALSKLQPQPMNKRNIEASGKSAAIPAELLAEPQLQPFGEELLAVNTALQQVTQLSAAIGQMQAICRTVDPDQAAQQEFEDLSVSSSAMVAQLQSSQRDYGQLRLDLASDGERQVEIHLQMPELSAITHTLYTSYAPDLLVNESTLHDCVDQRRQSSLQRSATIQGVRIFSRYPYDPGSSPQRAVNSMSSITGTRLCMIGNVLYPRTASRLTGIPLSTGEIAISSVNIAASEGTPEALVNQINLQTEEHGVHALLTDTGHLVLQRLDGEAIRLSVRSQTAAFLSGYSMGVVTRPCNSTGIPVWFVQPSSFSEATGTRPLIEFDSASTGQALTGRAVTSLELNPLHWGDLHCRDHHAAQFALVFLELINSQLASICTACLNALHCAIRQLEQLAGQCFVVLKNYLQQLQQTFFTVSENSLPSLEHS